ncbi:MAG: C/D box methylation guide ribonucleoprotein complex aNOP56 subunit [Caldisphaeraceae archaeon]|nr:C/D box methylation guide ribonucleoprotein complex aNOP56 subunit [Caldisphaeraceae archaeon]
MYSKLKIYIVDAISGTYALGEKGEVIAYEPLPKNYDEATESIINVYKGALSKSFLSIINKIKEVKPDVVVVEDESEAKVFNQEGLNVKVEEANSVALKFRSEMPSYIIASEFVKDEKEFYEWYFNVIYEFTRRMLRGAVQKRDLLVAQAIRAIDDIDKTVNLYSTRLREWYSIYFPELNDLVDNHELYAMLISELKRREEFTVSNLVSLGVSEGKARKIYEASRNSLGADVSEKDLEAMITLANITNLMYNLRKDLDQYASNVMKEVAPNVTELVGPLIGARLISLAGGLERLATMPASTIQVLGAEKALFRALRTGGKPPKHGIIFQYPEIYKSPKWQRGKIARALAAKLAIAAKVDAYSGRYIGNRLKEELNRRIEEIKRLYPTPPKRPIETKERKGFRKEKFKRSKHKKGGKRR